MFGDTRAISPGCSRSLKLGQALALGAASYLVSGCPLVTAAAL